MQLGLRFADARRSTALLAVSLACLVIGSEVFFRYSGLPPVKLAAQGLLAVGLLAMGLAEWSAKLLAMRAAAAIVYGAYLAQTCWRFFGLLKEHPPYAATDVAWLVLRVELFFALPVLAVAVATGYWQSRRNRAARE